MSPFKYAISFFSITVLLTNLTSYAQSQKDTLQYKVNLNLTGRKISGNFSQLVVGGGLNLDLQYNNWHLENGTTYRYNKTNTRVIEDNWYHLASLKYYPNGSRKLYPGVFYHFDNNVMFSVKHRHQFGMGLGSVLDKGAMNLSLLAAIAHENSTFGGSEFVNSDRDVFNRKNGMFLFQIKNGYAIAGGKINFSYQLFYFQSLKEAADYDLWFTPRINFKVIEGLSVFVVYDYRFEHVHLESLSNYNDIILFGFNLNLMGGD